MQNRIFSRIFVAAAIAAPLVVSAGPATAAPGDVSGTTSASGNVVTVKVTNNSQIKLDCQAAAVPPGGMHDAGNHVFSRKYAVAQGSSINLVSQALPDGEYSVVWVCITAREVYPDNSDPEVWHTFPDYPTSERYHQVGEPVDVALPAGGSPSPEPRPCWGSLC